MKLSRRAAATAVLLLASLTGCAAGSATPSPETTASASPDSVATASPTPAPVATPAEEAWTEGSLHSACLAFWQNRNIGVDPQPVLFGVEETFFSELDDGRWHVMIPGTVYYDESNPAIE
ncbi:MAG TPA: hypothetical protein VIL55_14575, partial [Naasia sp.]